MMSTEELLESKNAMWKREDQLQRWDASDTNKASAAARAADRVRFQDSCVFLAACASGDTEEVIRILKSSSADINTANVDGLTALHQACIDDNLEMVRFLVSNGADIDACDNEGWTSLHATASCGFSPIARYLIESGARLDAVNNDGELPLDLAEGNEMEALVSEAMEKQGIDADTARCEEEEIMLRDVNQWLNSGKLDDQPHPKTAATALHIAAAKGYIKVLKLLLEAGANKEARDVDGWTPIHAAAHWSQEEACRILAENLVNLDAKTNTGETVLDVADSDVESVVIELKRKQATILKERDSKVNGEILREQSPTKRRSSITSVTRMSGDQKHSIVVKNTEEERAQLDSVRTADLLDERKEDEEKSLVGEEEEKSCRQPSDSTGGAAVLKIRAEVDESPPALPTSPPPSVDIEPLAVNEGPVSPPPQPPTAAVVGVELVRRAEKREGSPADSVAIDAKKPATVADNAATTSQSSSESVRRSLGGSEVVPSLSEVGGRRAVVGGGAGGGVELRSVRSVVDRVTSNPVITAASSRDSTLASLNNPVITAAPSRASTLASLNRNTLSSSSFSGTRVLQESLLPSQWRASLRKIGSSPMINECGAATVKPLDKTTSASSRASIGESSSSRLSAEEQEHDQLNHYSLNGYGGSLNRSFVRGGVLRSTSATVGYKYTPPLPPQHDADSGVSKRSGSALLTGNDSEYRNRTFEPAKRDEEKEIERKARAKRARETRRSTQGVCKEDLEKAEEALKAARSTLSSDRDLSLTDKSSSSSSSTAATTTSTATVKPSGAISVVNATAATTTNSTTDVPALSTAVGFSRSLLRTAGKLPMTMAAAPVSTSAAVQPLGSATTTTSAASMSTSTAACTDAPHTSSVAGSSSGSGSSVSCSRMSAFRSRYLQEKAERDGEERRRAAAAAATAEVPTSTESGGQLDQKEDDSSVRWSSSRSRRKREGRPLTGRISYDPSSATLEDTSKSEENKNKPNNEINSLQTKSSSPAASDSLTRAGNRASAPPITSGTSTYTRFPYASSSSLNRDIDYKKLYEDEKLMNDQLRKEMKQLQADAADCRQQLERLRAANISSSSTPTLYRRAPSKDSTLGSSSSAELRPPAAEPAAAVSSLERRALERKISELEKELGLKNSDSSRENLNSENQRLKEENAALIRVISKLSK